MMLARRGFLTGLLAAPAIVRTLGLLMPVKPAVLTRSRLLSYLGSQAITQRALIPALYVQIYRGLPMWSVWAEEGV